METIVPGRVWALEQEQGIGFGLGVATNVRMTVVRTARRRAVGARPDRADGGVRGVVGEDRGRGEVLLLVDDAVRT